MYIVEGYLGLSSYHEALSLRFEKMIYREIQSFFEPKWSPICHSFLRSDLDTVTLLLTIANPETPPPTLPESLHADPDLVEFFQACFIRWDTICICFKSASRGGGLFCLRESLFLYCLTPPPPETQNFDQARQTCWNTRGWRSSLFKCPSVCLVTFQFISIFLGCYKLRVK